MSAIDRLEDARILYDTERYEGALLLVIVAISAASRIRYPQAGCRDKKAFVDYVEKMEISECCQLFDDKRVSAILYEWMRCDLVHEGKLGQKVVLYEDACDGDGASWTTDDDIVHIPHTMILTLMSHLIKMSELAGVSEDVRSYLCSPNCLPDSSVDASTTTTPAPQ